ncbi:MAG TPA: hypothetical protein VEL76_23870 [Gemmataceae bacterium]|nr:hypothetical protein [Gemmataceae bacterium]
MLFTRVENSVHVLREKFSRPPSGPIAVPDADHRVEIGDLDAVTSPVRRARTWPGPQPR